MHPPPPPLRSVCTRCEICAQGRREHDLLNFGRSLETVRARAFDKGQLASSPYLLPSHVFSSSSAPQPLLECGLTASGVTTSTARDAIGQIRLRDGLGHGIFATHSFLLEVSAGLATLASHTSMQRTSLSSKLASPTLHLMSSLVLPSPTAAATTVPTTIPSKNPTTRESTFLS
ncbi:unnamed protein product [Prorocentrum cordatum]|uniref:Uncharacterized protein n=1 Tax=Prorocentrum cordatum TaxID=2364126 RepID=A0ABN9T239_9DINO|nr:unnamed protein product [Polarella glacialis]